MKIKNSIQRGFTLIELIVVMGIISLLIGFVTLNLANLRKITSLNSEIDKLVFEMKSQQTKAMSSFGSATGENFGIYFQSDKYVLFTGSIYSATNASNFSVNLPSNINFASSTIPDNTIIFLRQSGELNGFIDGNNSITIQSTDGLEKKTLNVNRYGVVTNIN